MCEYALFIVHLLRRLCAAGTARDGFTHTIKYALTHNLAHRRPVGSYCSSFRSSASSLFTIIQLHTLGQLDRDVAAVELHRVLALGGEARVEAVELPVARLDGHALDIVR